MTKSSVFEKNRTAFQTLLGVFIANILVMFANSLMAHYLKLSVDELLLLFALFIADGLLGPLALVFACRHDWKRLEQIELNEYLQSLSSDL